MGLLSLPFRANTRLTHINSNVAVGPPPKTKSPALVHLSLFQFQIRHHRRTEWNDLIRLQKFRFHQQTRYRGNSCRILRQDAPGTFRRDLDLSVYNFSGDEERGEETVEDVRRHRFRCLVHLRRNDGLLPGLGGDVDVTNVLADVCPDIHEQDV